MRLGCGVLPISIVEYIGRAERAKEKDGRFRGEGFR
jgi:hypothetical protein